MKNALVIGGCSGIGLAIVRRLLKEDYAKIYIVDKSIPDSVFLDLGIGHCEERICFIKKNLVDSDLSFLNQCEQVNSLIITAGFGRVALFEDLAEAEVVNLMKVNLEAAVRIIKHFYPSIKSKKDFYTAILVSIAGRIVSPFFSVYGASKAGLRFLIENCNCELRAGGFSNRILEVSPGSLSGTSFNGGKTDLALLNELASSIVGKMFSRETLYIPNFDNVYKGVLARYTADPEAFGDSSYSYKTQSGRLSSKPQLIVGYLSGTFDLFHIGHLNLLRRAKEQCDYLIVSVHADGSWKGKETFIPYEERKAIVESIKYVDEVVRDYVEDYDAWDQYHYNKLFVGSDYKGTERFKRYEELLKGKADIIYFPYTKGTSSTQLREALKK